jgi:peptide/nickel transport system substrate-binding protein
MAIDREGLLDAVLRGYGSVASGIVPPWHPYSPGLEPLPYDPDSASAILDGLGWRDRDGDGVRDRDGAPFRFVLLASQRNPVFGDLVQVIQAQLARIGVEVEPRLLEWQTVLSAHRARDFDAVLTNWVLDNFRIDPRPLFHSSQLSVEGSANRSSYANPVADSLMDRGARTLDADEARRIWRRFSRIVQRDQPVTFLFWNDELAGVSEELTGVRMDARGELVTLPRWRWR